MSWRLAAPILVAIGTVACAPRVVATPPSVRGANVVQTPNAVLGSPEAAQSLRNLRDLGATTVALVPFLWQPDSTSPAIVAGDAVSLSQLAAGIRQGHDAGLLVMVKPHVWVPHTWAGAIEMASEHDWQLWFRAYSTHLLTIADVAQRERAEYLAVGVELRRTIGRVPWESLISEVRARYDGRLTFVTDNLDEARRIGFWDALDIIAISSYPTLGTTGRVDDIDGRVAAHAREICAFGATRRQPLWVAEVGVRSAAGAHERPWESPEQREAAPDLALQARIMDSWLRHLTPPCVSGVLIWRWFTDPGAGGASDTDFTIQGKPAERVLRDRWSPARVTERPPVRTPPAAPRSSP